MPVSKLADGVVALDLIQGQLVRHRARKDTFPLLLLRRTAHEGCQFCQILVKHLDDSLSTRSTEILKTWGSIGKDPEVVIRYRYLCAPGRGSETFLAREWPYFLSQLQFVIELRTSHRRFDIEPLSLNFRVGSIPGERIQSLRSDF